MRHSTLKIIIVILILLLAYQNQYYIEDVIKNIDKKIKGQEIKYMQYTPSANYDTNNIKYEIKVVDDTGRIQYQRPGYGLKKECFISVRPLISVEITGDCSTKEMDIVQQYYLSNGMR